ncbi:flagellar hook-associated protein 2 [Halolactibacillus alkaliphilus]|uniref:Flagellar hook-associated protein 2 n=1 Tax=Halolactibacillus alkaliphilus TaxID=442899 RepID=A0A511X0S5_9BACI|nr:flagellar hook-associated protein 2 [Halolactibacillus alkaliphilus]GEN56553.1 flagellar hook-associated protein 2 [Halolactibacillus alkaliphilus]GGN69289.1 flagellar hook-associated protein 2 [Halolactibacillus alkaliphilus]SFO75100.1 flagellar hook-associated protein 2 [Halolactibacillus alkaliphilus]
MRISGFASGMDIDQMVKDLMRAERIPLNKIEANKTKLEWQRDAYRDFNVKLRDLDDALLNMRLQSNLMTKKAVTSNNAVTATANSRASNGSYRIEVSQLATSAINVSQDTLTASGKTKIDPLQTIKSQVEADNGSRFRGLTSFGTEEKIEFTTVHNGKLINETIIITEDDTLDSVLTKITNKDNGVRAFYDTTQDKIILEKEKAGNYRGAETDAEIWFEDDSFMANLFGMSAGNETGGKDAVFKYNGVELTSKTNQTTLNGITFTFNNVTNDTPAYVNITDDTDGAVDKIVKFVEQYNALVDEITSKTRETVYRDYNPLTSEEMNELSEREVEMWEEKARSGLLKNDRILMDGLSAMRQAWTGSVEADGNFKHLSAIGITTSRDYMDGGKLVIDEDKLRAALRDDPASVNKLFTNSSTGSDRGIFNKLNDAIDQTVDRINDRAGRSTSQNHQFAIGRQISNMNTRIDNFNRRLTQVENRYWSQFTAMEKAMQKMNEQSNFLYSQMMGQY